MIEIEEIIDNDRKKKIADEVLRSLPDWFGIESAIVEYVEGVTKYRFYIALYNGELAGFVSVDNNNQVTAEIYVMGIFKNFHRKGIGKALIKTIKEIVKNEGFRLLMVKTLGKSHPDINYGITRKFYGGVGFLPVQEIEEIWGKESPCLIMVQGL